MKILITGHLGFIGSVLYYKLAKSNDVLGIDVKEGNFLSKLGSASREQWDVIYHLGAVSGFSQCLDDIEKTWYHNVELTNTYLSFRYKKFVFASSAAVGSMLELDALPSLYALTKLAGALMVENTGNCVATLSNVYGPGSKDKTSVVASMFKSALRDGVIKLDTTEGLTRDFVYIETVVDELISMENNANIRSSEETRLEKLACYIKDLTNADIVDMDSGKKVPQRFFTLGYENNELYKNLIETYKYFKSFNVEELY